MIVLPDTEKPLSPEIIEAVVQKYHYYILGFDLPEDVALLARTNTPAAPWTVVESSDKWYARLKTLQTVISYGEQIL